MPLNQRRRHARKSGVHLPKKYAESLGYSASKIKELDRRRVAQEDKAYNEVRKAEISRRDALRQIEKEHTYIDQLLKNKDLPFTQRRGLERLEGDLAKEEVKILTQTSGFSVPPKTIKIAKFTSINGVPISDEEGVKLAEALYRKDKELPNTEYKIFKPKNIKPKTPPIPPGYKPKYEKFDAPLVNRVPIEEEEIPQEEIDRISREMEIELRKLDEDRRIADEAKRLRAEEGAYDLGQLFGQGSYVDGHKKSDLRRLLMSHALHQIRHHY